MSDEARCPRCGAARDPVSDKYPPGNEFYLCGLYVRDGKPSEWQQPGKCRIASLERDNAILRRLLMDGPSPYRMKTSQGMWSADEIEKELEQGRKS